MVRVFESTEERTFELQKSAELTDDENKLTQGSLKVRFAPLAPWASLVMDYVDSVLVIESANGLASCSSFGLGSANPYCVVYRACRLEAAGGIEKELLRTAPVMRPVAPAFVDERVAVTLPADLQGVSLRIEVWDLGGQFLGGVELSHTQIKELLFRDHETCLQTQQSFALTTSTRWICGVRYGGVEQSVLLDNDAPLVAAVD